MHPSVEPLVSVIVLNYNNGQFLGRCLQSVVNQTYRKLEIIVVENGSTDNSLEILNSFFGKIKVWRNVVNKGQAIGRNQGISIAQGDIIAFLDSDDYWHESKVELQLKLISKDFSLVYCNAYRLEGNTQTIMKSHFSGDCGNSFLSPKMPAVVLCGESSAMLTTDLVRKVGGFDETLNSSSGWDFFRRCAIFTKFALVEEPLVMYRIHDGNMSRKILEGCIDKQNAFYKALIQSDQSGKQNLVNFLIFQLFLWKMIITSRFRTRASFSRFPQFLLETVKLDLKITSIALGWRKSK